MSSSNTTHTSKIFTRLTKPLGISYRIETLHFLKWRFAVHAHIIFFRPGCEGALHWYTSSLDATFHDIRSTNISKAYLDWARVCRIKTNVRRIDTHHPYGNLIGRVCAYVTGSEYQKIIWLQYAPDLYWERLFSMIENLGTIYLFNFG